MTGMREQEVMYTYWSDVNLNKHVVRVTHKPDRNWTPKAYREREIPIPDKLAVALKAWKAKSDKSCKLLRACQSWMGHKDLESTMRYLKPNPAKKYESRSTTCSPELGALLVY
jgi:integrase